MTRGESETDYKQALIARTKLARNSRGFKQWQVAEVLGIPQDQYKHYEISREMPHRYIGKFCSYCEVDVAWFVTGHGKMSSKQKPTLVPEPAEPQVRKPGPKRSA